MFLKMAKQFTAIVCFSLFLLSCNEYQKVLKNTEVKPKYDMAEKFYNEGDYMRAKRLFEQIMPKYVGKPQGERVMFFFADSYFKDGDYYLSGYQFERFIKSYPQSEKLQEALFLEAKSYYMVSPKYSLDQTDTNKALAKLQNFINTYPDSEYFEEANTMAQELTRKKQKKEIEIAKQYEKIGEFDLPRLVSAVAALNNFISENPGSIYKEDALYYRLKAATFWAENSIFSRQPERFQEAKDFYEDLIKAYPDTKFDKEASSLLKKIEKNLNRDKALSK